jgi:hypothetical protein
MFLDLLDPYPLVRGLDTDPAPESLGKNIKKNLHFYCFVASIDVLSLKNDVKVPSKSRMQKNFFSN